MQNQAEKIDFEIRTYTFIREGRLEVFGATNLVGGNFSYMELF